MALGVEVVALAFALLLALAHVLGGTIGFLDVAPRSRWLSLSSGVSVAYIFVHVMPELARGQIVVAETLQSPWLRALESHLYLVSMAGLAAYYGLEHMVRTSVTTRDARESDEPTGSDVFSVHLGSFALYNVLVGYLLLHRESPSLASLALFGLAMLAHFLVNDYGLRQDHRRRYVHTGRWVLAAAVLGGWALGMVQNAGEVAVAVLFAFLAGGVILNVLKEELPAAQASRFRPFLVGVVVYTALLLAL